MKPSIVLPTLDEAENIVALMRRLIEVCPDVHELIVVDDDSPDGTAEVAEDFGKTQRPGRVRVERVKGYGLTKSLWRGITAVSGDVIVWMDCDFSMPPELVPSLLREVERGADIAVGSRFVSGGSFKRNTEGTPDSWVAVLLSRVMNYSIRFLLNPRFGDYTSGFAAVRRPVFDAVPFRGDYGEYFIDFIYRALRKGYRVVEIPYVCVPRQKGYSKTGQTLPQYLRRGSKYVQVALELRWEALLGRI